MKPTQRALGVVLASAWTITSCGGSPGRPSSPLAPSTPVASTWAVSGSVLQTPGPAPVAGARVEVVDGPNQGRATAADQQGRYRLDDLAPGIFSLRASADGFEPETRSVALTANQVVDFTLRRPVPRGVTGTVREALSDSVLAGIVVQVDGIGEVSTGPDGLFELNAPDPEVVRAVSLTSPSVVQRVTRLRVPGPHATLSLIPAAFDLNTYDQMFRHTGRLQRWITSPPVVVQKRVLAFTSVSANEYTGTADVMSDATASGLLADLLWALPQVTGGRFTGFAGERQETAGVGERVSVSRTGEIVVARFDGLQAATGYWGYGRWAVDSEGSVRGGIIMLDRAFDTSESQFRRSLRVHELGHALGYGHVTSRDSFMNSSARIEPNAFDRDASKVAFQRDPGNRSPDMDPEKFTGNLRAAGAVVWAKGLP